MKALHTRKSALEEPPAPPPLPKHWDPQWVETLLGCKNCRLCSTRKTVVVGEGNLESQVVFVGEAPGEQEDLQGKPFVGPAGQLLTRMLAAIGFQREDVFIGNVIKCRPPGNRNPEPDEIAACFPYIEHQLSLIAPKLIVTLGKFATTTLLKQEISITRVRGQLFDYPSERFQAKVLPTFHPSYLLRNPSAKREAWEDLQQVARILEKELPVRPRPGSA